MNFISKVVYYRLLSLVTLLFVSLSLLAEGTKQMSPVNSVNGTALIVWPANTRGPYLNAPVDQRLQFTIDDNTTENLYFGFHPRTYNNLFTFPVLDAYYKIYNQAGVQVVGPTIIPITGVGHIANYNRAVAGPNIAGATPAGYTPFTFDPITNGDFYIEIYRSSDGGVTSNNLEIMMPFFDFTVSDVSNNQIEGRVWSRKWSFTTVDLVGAVGGFNSFKNAIGGSSLADFFVYTQDQQILSIDFQTGFNPLAFEVTTNYYGVSNTGNFLNDRRSTNNFTGLSPTLANGYQIFLNQPDLNIYPVSATSQPAITSSIFGCTGNYYIPFVIAEAGDVSVFLDLDGNSGYQAGTADVVIEDYGLTPGNHLMAWDGLDGLGNIAPVNTSTNVVITLYRGRTNIPLFDAELNTNGITVTGLFPSTNNRPLYWDDQLLVASSGSCNAGTNNTVVSVVGSSAQAGMLDGQFGPAHAWDGTGTGIAVPAPNSGSDGSATPNLLCDDFGNLRTINTWFWALDVSSPVTAMVIPNCDVDGDGIDDITDVDNDNDGILDVDENIDDPFGDNDGDLIYNYLDLDYPGYVDVNSDGVNDLFDLDLDGLVNAIDLDSDGDGCLDVFEAGFTDVSPADGEVDGTGYNSDGTVIGSDGYGLPADLNANSIPDFLENIDTDSDGLGDNCDPDDDNDGVLDVNDNAPLDPSSCIDADGDGCDDCSQTANNDFDAGANNDPLNDGLDTDGDGICDFGDPDDDNDGCLDANDTDPLVANPMNVKASASPNAICAGETVSLSGSGGITYSWDNGLGSGATQTVNPTTTTTYVVTGNNGLGCTSTGTVVVTVTPRPSTPSVGNNGPLCVGDSLSLVTSTLTGATYSWTGPNGFTSTDQNPTVSLSSTALMSGAYTVTATVSGCASLPATTNVIVTTTPSAPTAGSNSPVCITSGNINLTASLVAGATYSWTGPNSYTANVQNPVINAASLAGAGTYSVIATVGGCVSSSNSVTIVVTICGPTANDDVVTTNLVEDGANGTVNILTNDTDTDGTPVAPSNGTGQYVVDLDPSTPGIQTTFSDATGTWTYNTTTGVVTFDPANNYNGTATVSYDLFDPEGNVDQAVITFTVDPINDAPSQGNETLTVNEDDAATTSADLTTNNIDPDGTATTVTTIVSSTGNGTIINNNDGTIDYTPAPNFNGVDTVIYTVCDNGLPLPVVCINDTLFVTVNPINDAPSQGNETLTVNEDDAATTSGDLTTNNIDPDGTATTVTTIVSSTGNGTIINNNDGTIDYTPAPNFNGVDTVIYTVCDNGLPLPVVCINDTLFVIVNPINDAPSQGNETLTVNEDDAATTSADLTTNNIDPDGTATTVTTIVSSTGNGTIINNNDGTIDYTPAPNFNGVDTVIYTVCDNGLPLPVACVNDTLFVTVNPINDAPSQGNETLTVNEDDAATTSGDLTTNNIDPDGTATTVTTIVSSTGNGTIINNNDGTIDYTPAPNFNGVDTVIYTVCDNGLPLPAVCVNDTLFVTVNPINDAPSQGNETLTVNEDDAATTSGDLTTNNIDPDGTVITVTTIVSNTGGGTIVNNNDGTIDYTPAPNFNGVDTVIYTVCDNGLPLPVVCINDTLFVTVNPINDAPSQGNETLTVNEDAAATTSADLTTNNIDPDGTVITVTTIVSSTGGGTVVNNNDGTVDYTPAPNFNGVDTVIYTVCDNGLPLPVVCINDTLFVTVNPINDAPSQGNETLTVNEDDAATTSADLTTNNIDPDGTVITVTTIVSNTGGGTIVNNNDGTIDYTPAPNFNGVDTVIYTVCDNGLPLPVVCINDTLFVTVNPINDAPSQGNETLTVNEDAAATTSADLTTNNIDPDGTVITVTTIVSNTGGGTIVNNNDGTIDYTPAPNFNGVDTVIYTVCDNGLPLPVACVNDTLFVTVNPINDAPSQGNETLTVNEDDAATTSADLTTNNIDPDGTVITVTTIVSSTGNGTIINNNDGTIDYTPAPNFNGVDTVIYTVCDNGLPLPAVCVNDTLFVTVNPINDAPSQGNETLTVNEDAAATTSADLTTNNIDPDGTVITVTTIVSNTGGGTIVNNNDGTIDYTPAPNFNGVDTVIYTVCDNGLPLPVACVNDTLFVTVNPINDAPSQGNETLTVNEDDAATTSADLTTNNIDPDGTVITVTTIVSSTGNGTIINNNDGTIDYTPAPNFNGVDTVIYTVCDNGLPLPAVCVNDTLFVTVNPINDAPSQGNETLTVNEDDAATTSGDLTTNNIDPDGTATTVTTIVSSTGNGTIVNNNDGTIDYTPAPNFNGVDTVIYTVCDNGLPLPVVCVNDTLFVTVNAVNDAPIIDNEYLTTTLNTPVSGDLTDAGDSDLDGNLVVTTTPLSGPTNGTITINADGTFTYTPTTGFVGLDTVLVTICDDGTPLPIICVTDTIFITVIDCDLSDSTEDCDGDGVTNGDELLDGTDPINSCDFNLVSVSLIPNAAWLANDCDGDGVVNGVELTDGTNPLDACEFTLTSITLPITSVTDCDGDGVANVDELTDGTNPFDDCDYLTSNITLPITSISDCDGDGVTNADEYNDGTNPLDACEFTLTSITLPITSVTDCDGDGVTNADEITNGTNPFDVCDFLVADITLPITISSDCDGDGVTTANEILGGTDPFDGCSLNVLAQTVTPDAVWLTNDCDGDGVDNGTEVTNGTDPILPCDPIQLPGYTGYDASNPIWAAEDCDNDGDLNGDEVNAGTPSDPYCNQSTIANPTGVCCDPTDITLDCDGDGVLNGAELADGTNPYDACDFNILSANVLPNAAWMASDCDGDGVTNADEIAGADGDPLTLGDNTDPLDACNYNVAQITITVSASGDCDGDGVTDTDENLGPDGIVNTGDETDPQDACDFDLSSITLPITIIIDCDGDGVTNADEFTDNTDPQDPCDYLVGSVTVAPTGNWLSADCDGDGVTNEDELNGVDGDPLTTNDNTDPNNPCDFFVGSITLPQGGDWSTVDCDGDGVTNEQEVLDGTSTTDPCDLLLASQNTTPDASWLTADCDNDGLSNEEEISGVDDLLTPDTPNGEITDPFNSDSDGDGVIDGVEGTDGTNPNEPCDYETINITETQGGDWSAADCDGDGVTNEQEVLDNTSTTAPCDLILTSQNTTPDSTWLASDCDNDGLTNEEETTGIDDPSTSVNPNGNVTDPLNPDTDGDGVTDGVEAVDGTNPTDPCDLIIENQDVSPSNGWNDADCDNDGLTNGEETSGIDNPLSVANPNGAITDPLNPDSDGDGVLDGTETVDETDPNDPCSFDEASITVDITAEAPCQIHIPEGFSPNGDGVNDYFVIGGINNYEKVEVIIMNRWGNKVYESNAYQNDWDGTNQAGSSIGGNELPVSTYFYLINLGEGEEVIKGYVYLNR